MGKVIELIDKFKAWEYGTGKGLDLDEVTYLMSREEDIDYYTYRDISDYKDHMEMEGWE